MAQAHPPKDNRTAYVPVRLTPDGERLLDEVRGSWSRSEYIRQALAFSHQEGLRGPRTRW